MKNHPRRLLLIAACLAAVPIAPNVPAADASSPAQPPPLTAAPAVADATKEWTLEDCLSTALERNHRRPASRFAVAVAEAQHRQALAAYWPQISARGGYQRTDEAPNFLFPSSSFNLPAQVIALPPGLSIPLEGPGGVRVGALDSIPVPAQQINIPAQDIRLMDEDSFLASIRASWLLYDGGMRKGYREQTAGLVEMMKAEARRTDLELTDSVRRYYYGAVLAAQLRQVGEDTLARMEATLSLTETMYKEGAGTVKKTDFLNNKVMVESLRAMVALLEKNAALARAALANTMGLPWNASVRPADRELPYSPFSGDLGKLVSSAYQFNPDWAKLEAGIRAAEGTVRTARSGHYPKLVLTGEVHKWWNDADAGMATDENKEGWTAGVGIEIPLFSGFLTRNKVAAGRARVDQLREQRFLLKAGLGLQIKDIFLGLIAAQQAFTATQAAMQAAVENRDLNTRAYQNELVETEEVIRAQLIEALMQAQHYKTRYDHLALISRLNLVVGAEVLDKLEAR